MPKEKLIYVGELWAYSKSLLPINLKAVSPGVRIIHHFRANTTFWISSLLTIQDYKKYCDPDIHYYPFWHPFNIQFASQEIYA